MTMTMEKADGPSLAMIVHMRGDFAPPLPVEYAAWADRLIEKVDSEGGVQYAEWDQDVTVPHDVLKVGPVPRRMRVVDGAHLVRLGDIVEALRIYDACYDSDADTEQDDDTEETDGAEQDGAAVDAGVDGGTAARSGCYCACGCCGLR